MESENEETGNGKQMTVLELFSGIGGMRGAFCKYFEGENIDMGSKFVPFDINVLANSIYFYNFQEEVHKNNLETISPQTLDSISHQQPLNQVMWMMSPPCQPYSRQGNVKDIDDSRAKPLLNLISVLPKLQYQPHYILLENVKNFEISKSYEILKDMLIQENYYIQHYFLSPTMLGIPNQRLRFFLLARKNKELSHENIEESKFNTPTIAEYLECVDNSVYNMSQFMISDAVLQKKSSLAFDIVSPDNNKTLCFTKNYAKLIKGSGSVLQIQNKQSETETMMDYSQKLRYFTPNEILRLHSFPTTFTFPSELSIRHQYELIGNSLNLDVVAYLLKILLKN